MNTQRQAGAVYRAWLVALLAVLMGAASPSAATDDPVTLKLIDADIEMVTRLVSQMTGRNFLIDPRVKGNVSLISSAPVRRSQVYPIFLSALRTHGFAVIEGPDTTRIVPEADAKHHAVPSVTRAATVTGDRMVTLTYALVHESAAQMVVVLRPLVSPVGNIATLPGANTLVITDYADNANRLATLAQNLDRGDRGELVIIALRHASAVDVAQAISRLMPEASTAPAGAGAPPARMAVAADTRSNSLLVRAGSPAELARVVSIVAGLDVPARASGTVHLVHLRNADAVKLAETLRSIAGIDPRNAVAAPVPAVPIPPGGAAVITAPPPLPVASFIQADAATNSLIISAPDAVYNSLRAVIERLDTRRAQVYIEALIAEVSTDKAAEFGFQFQDLSGATGGSGTRVIGGTNFSTTPGNNIFEVATKVTNAGPGLNVGVVRGRLTIPGIGEILDLKVLARALVSNADANILSTPNLVTMDNEEAKIVVGQNVPFITGSFAPTSVPGGAAVSPFQTIERKDVGLTLRVRPQISEGRTVRLRIYQEVSSVQDTSNAAGIITNKRSIESTVLVEDTEIVVLGGLVQDDVKNNTDKVPLLGDLPVIGALFRFDARRRVKSNLMVFLRPVVLRDGAAANTITQDRYDYIRNEQGGIVVPGHLLLPEFPTPLLPALPRSVP